MTVRFALFVSVSGFSLSLTISFANPEFRSSMKRWKIYLKAHQKLSCGNLEFCFAERGLSLKSHSYTKTSSWRARDLHFLSGRSKSLFLGLLNFFPLRHFLPRYSNLDVTCGFIRGNMANAVAQVILRCEDANETLCLGRWINWQVSPRRADRLTATYLFACPTREWPNRAIADHLHIHGHFGGQVDW